MDMDMDNYFSFGLFFCFYACLRGLCVLSPFLLSFLCVSYSSLAFHGIEDTPSFWGFVCMTDDLMSSFDVLNISVDILFVDSIDWKSELFVTAHTLLRPALQSRVIVQYHKP